MSDHGLRLIFKTAVSVAVLFSAILIFTYVKSGVLLAELIAVVAIAVVTAIVSASVRKNRY